MVSSPHLSLTVTTDFLEQQQDNRLLDLVQGFEPHVSPAFSQW